MATEAEVEEACEELQEAIDNVADDTARFSQEDSVEIWETLASHCTARAQLTRSEMGG
jgi:hypothetical protein